MEGPPRTGGLFVCHPHVWRSRASLTTLLPVTLPSWPLLLWCGTAATCAAATIGALIGGRRPAPWSLAPRPRSPSHGLAVTLLAGMFLLPLVYGLAFEVLQQATIVTGLGVGAAHAAGSVLAARPRDEPRQAFSSAVVALVYGAAIGFFYITP
jgi:hypothetical protein